MSEDRTGAYQRAGVGLGLLTAGELAGARIASHGSKKAKVASKIVPRGLGAAGIPLAATGLVGIAQRKRSERVRLRDVPKDVVNHTIAVPGMGPKKEHSQVKAALVATGAALAGGQAGRRYAAHRGAGVYRRAAAGALGTGTGAATATLAQRHFSKTYEDDVAAYKRKKHNTLAGLGATTLGTTALLLRAPKLAKTGRLKAIAPRAEHWSNRVGVTAAAAGSYGGVASFRNSHHELKREKKRLAAEAPAVAKDDSFLRQHRDRISPSAEKGYEYLRAGRNKRRAHAGVSGALAVANVPGILRGGKVMRPLAATAAVASGYDAVRQGQAAHRWNGQMGKIQSRARQRARDGEWGQDRKVDLAKALTRGAPGLPLPKGLARTRAPRSGGLRRLPNGSQVTVRGSFG